MQPLITDWQGKYNFELIIVSSDSRQEMSKFVSQNSITAQVVLDSQGAVFRQFKAQTIPRSFLFDNQGELKESYVGWRGDSSIKQIESGLQSQ